MAIQKTDAIVLKTQPFRSSSLIITFFTRSFGKLRGLAKGVRQENQTRFALDRIGEHPSAVGRQRQGAPVAQAHRGRAIGRSQKDAGSPAATGSAF